MTALPETASALPDTLDLLERFFAGSVDGFFFMMLDQPIRWDDGTDKEALLDYVFTHQRVTRANDAMLAQYGATRAQFMGLTPADVYAHDLPEGRAVWRRFFDAGRLHVETAERRLDGTPIRIEGDYLCLYDAEGRIIGHCGVQRDVTERWRQQEALHRSRQQLRDLSARQVQGREEERARIAREIHDELGQALTGLRMDLVWLRSRLGRRTAEVAERADSMLARIDGTLTSVRRIATELRPSVLDDLGLVAAVEWLAHEFHKRTGILTRVRAPADLPRLDDESSTTVFRILQEALTNIMRHAGATRTEITLEQDGRRLVLDVQDNGRGITAEEVAAPRSLGLIGLRERALARGGTLEIHGTAGFGTFVRAVIPLAAETAE